MTYKVEKKPKVPKTLSKSHRPPTQRIPQHNEATASIFIHGLSILCANDKENTTEIAFVQMDHTPVHIKIYKNGCAPFWSHTCVITDKTKIEIKKNNPQGMGEFYEDNKLFDEDFSWMPDLEEWHPQAKIGIQPHAKDHLSAKLVISDATFYTKLKSISEGERMLNSTPTKIGRVGRILGADIVCEDNEEIILTVDNGTKTLIKLTKKEGPFFIVVYTKPTSSGSHLHHIYENIVDLPSAEPRYDFQYVTKEPSWKLCHPIQVKATEFACQTFGGGDGPLPDFP